MKRTKLCVSVLITAAVLLYLASGTGIISRNASANYLGNVIRTGHVTVRGLVKGPSGKPIFAEYDRDGNVKEVIGEAAGDYEDAFAMSGSDYRSHVKKYEDLADRYKDSIGEEAYILTRDAYENKDTVFMTAFSEAHPEPEIIPKPELRPDTLSVYVMADKFLVRNDISPILLESPIKLDDELMKTVTDEYGSVLLGKEGQVMHKALFGIGYRLAYYHDPKAPVTDASGDSAVLMQPGYVRTAPAKQSPVRCSRGLGMTDENGQFFMSYNIPPCPGFIYSYPTSMWAELSYRTFNPKSERSSFAIWPVGMSVFETCNGLGHGGPEMSVPGAAVQADLQADSVSANRIKYEIRADALLFTGSGILKNPDGTPEITVADITAEENSTTSYDPGEIPNADWPEETETEMHNRLVRGVLWNSAESLYGEKARIWDIDGDGLHDLAVAGTDTGMVEFYSKGKEPTGFRPDFSRYSQVKALEAEELPEDKPVSEDMFGETQLFVYKSENKDMILIYSEYELDSENLGDGGFYTAKLPVSADVQKDEAAEAVLTWRDESEAYMLRTDTQVKEIEYNSLKRLAISFIPEKTLLKGPRYEISEPGPEHRGLLSVISADDLKNTDVYIFRESDGSFVAERIGLGDSEVSDIADGKPLVSFRVTGRGSKFKDYTAGSFWSFHESEKEKGEPELPEWQKDPDDLKTGGRVKAVVINRTTGYIATASAQIGSGDADYRLGRIELRPPNLKIWAERTTEAVERGKTKDEQRTNIIGFEGSGLKSDASVVIKTEWLDHDGSLLPDALPGYTARLAKVTAPNELTEVVSENQTGDSAFFSIRPGRHTELVTLPDDAEVSNDHFYINVCGSPRDRNPDFATPENPEEDENLSELLKYRPEKYVPVLVPFFNREETLKNVYARAVIEYTEWAGESEEPPPAPVIENFDRVYDWAYRPEVQFTLFDLDTRNFEMQTEFDVSEDRGVTVLDFDYDLLIPVNPESDSDPKEDLDPLERFEGDRTMLFGMGYGEFTASDGAEQHAEITYLEYLTGMMPGRYLMALEEGTDLLEPEDWLGLRLYQADDPGNALFEIYEFPLILTEVKPFVLKQTDYKLLFDDVSQDTVSEAVNGYRAFEFVLTGESKVKATLKYKEKGAEKEAGIVEEIQLEPGAYVFLLDYETAKAKGLDIIENEDISPNFTVVLRADSFPDTSAFQEVHFPGRIDENVTGPVLGQVSAHNVLIADGSLNISRQDLAVEGRDPDFVFTRSYTNLPGEDPYEPMGYGWAHSLDLKLEPLCSEGEVSANCVPGWVKNKLGTFFKPGSVTINPEKWTSVRVNGTKFKKAGDKWHPHKGRHGKLEEFPEEIPPGSLPTHFIYTSKEGTGYRYKYPERTEEEIPLYMKIGDDIITGIGMHPESLRLADTDPSVKKYMMDRPMPTQVESIKDRNGNEMTFEYEEKTPPEQNLLIKVTDSVEREFTFEYKKLPAGWAGNRNRLVKVTGPEVLSPGKKKRNQQYPAEPVILEFEYNERGQLMSAARSERIEKYEYEAEPAREDANFNLTEITDANTHSYGYEYHNPGEVKSSEGVFIREPLLSQDVVKKVVYPDKNYAEFTYDISVGNNTRTVKDLRKISTVYTLNYCGNPTITDEADGTRVTEMMWSYDDDKPDNVMLEKTLKNRKTVAGPDSVSSQSITTKYSYDTKGNLTEETADDFVTVIRTQWDQDFSLPTYRKDRNDRIQRWFYDGSGNLMTYTDGDINDFSYTYDEVTGDRKTMTTPEKDAKTTYHYDNYGNPLRTEHPEPGSRTLYSYDIRGRLRGVTDPEQNRTEYEYDDLNYRTKITYPAVTKYAMPEGSLNFHTYDYDAVGNLKSETDPLGLTRTYTHTERDQLKTVSRSPVGGMKKFFYDGNGNLTDESDWKGVFTTHTYDTLNRRESTTNRLLDPMYTEYDEADNLIKVTDYEKNTTWYGYDILNRKTDIWQPAMDGQEAGHTEMTYYKEADPGTNLKSVTDQEGNMTQYEYNGRYLRTKRINAYLDEYKLEYDDNGNLEKETDEEKNETEYKYDVMNRVSSVTRHCPDCQTHGSVMAGYEYDMNGNRTKITDPRENVTEIEYDAWNQPWKATGPGCDENGSPIITYTEYDGAGNTVRTVDGRKTERKWKRDRRGLVREYTDGNKETTFYEYDLNGSRDRITNARETVTKITYDDEGREKTVTEALGTDVERIREVILRDRMGNPVQVKDFNKKITKVLYNPLYLPEKITDPPPSGKFVKMTYYKNGKIKQKTDRRTHPTDYEYDDLNRLSLVRDHKGYTIEIGYGKVGNVKTAEDKREIITENFYDDLYRVVRVERKGLTVAKNRYDEAGNLRFAEDAKENTTEYVYNSRNMPEKIIYEETEPPETMKYDGNGNLKEITDVTGRLAVYEYDGENRNISVEFAGEKTRRKYDAVGNLKSVTMPEGNVRSMEYDWLNRLKSVTDDLPPEPGRRNGGSLNLTTRFEYDGNGNLRHQFDPRGLHTEFIYNELNLREKHIEPNGVFTEFVYDEEGNIKSVTDPNKNLITYDYDSLGRQTDVYYEAGKPSPSFEITHVHTDYDGNSNVTKITETKKNPDSSVFADMTETVYDDFDRPDYSTQRGMMTDYDY
ncbi:MAG: RHS repeat protein, partial [Planctomycetes bacterium]|nr:RHS repeat protein [Planctomycetota bacterium]